MRLLVPAKNRSDKSLEMKAAAQFPITNSLDPDFVCIPEILGPAGYRTARLGKWHLGDNYPCRPHDRGFDESLWFPSSHISSLPDYWENDYFDDVYCHNGMRERYQGYPAYMERTRRFFPGIY